jgi:hypothetical protein
MSQPFFWYKMSQLQPRKDAEALSVFNGNPRKKIVPTTKQTSINPIQDGAMDKAANSFNVFGC